MSCASGLCCLPGGDEFRGTTDYCGRIGRKESVEESNAQIPPGAIQTGDDFYMVPIGKDSNGCAQFRPWSKSLMVHAAIYYRKADGGFTLDYPVACGTGS